MISIRPRAIHPTLSKRLATSFLAIFWIVSVLLVACASLDSRMAGYVGKHQDELISNWGPPNEATKLKKGGTRIVYIEQLPLINPNQYVDPSLRICEKIFITDSRGIIKSYRHNNCE